MFTGYSIEVIPSSRTLLNEIYERVSSFNSAKQIHDELICFSLEVVFHSIILNYDTTRTLYKNGDWWNISTLVRKLGPIQTKWVTDLETYPERQETGVLGTVSFTKSENPTVKACCLGQFLLSAKGGSCLSLLSNSDSSVCLMIEDEESSELLKPSYLELGLYTDTAHLVGTLLEYEGEKYKSLGQANDACVPWPIIASFIRKNLSAVFFKEV